MSFKATVLTLFPEMFPGPLGVSLAGKALEQGICRSRPVTSGLRRATGTAPSTTTPQGAAPAWC